MNSSTIILPCLCVFSFIFICAANSESKISNEKSVLSKQISTGDGPRYQTVLNNLSGTVETEENQNFSLNNSTVPTGEGPTTPIDELIRLVAAMLLLVFLLFTLVGTTINADDEPVAKRACPSRCKSTCRNPRPANCSPNPACSCQQGYVYLNSGSNTCIPTYQCPTNAPCNGDNNAEIRSPVIACPATCQHPEQSNCNKPNLPVGCVCKTGYILNRPGGRCIRANRCPCGSPCHGGNRTFVNCFFNCPYHYCPVDDSNVFIPCDPVWPCPTGCRCKNGYLITNGECVLPEDCPPFECTRPNEEWDGCPPPCYTDNCYDVPNWSQPCDNNDPFACKPACRCVSGYARGTDGICVPVADCPP